MQQEYNSLLVNALNRISKSNLSLNNFKWLLTKLKLSCVWSIIPRSRKRLRNGYPLLNQELQNHDPVGRTRKVMHGSTPPPGGWESKWGKNKSSDFQWSDFSSSSFLTATIPLKRELMAQTYSFRECQFMFELQSLPWVQRQSGEKKLFARVGS